jgi:hypothetical protein
MLPRHRDWISAGGIISALIYGVLESFSKDVYNFTKYAISDLSFQPYTIPAAAAIVCAGILIYDVLDRRKNPKYKSELGL